MPRIRIPILLLALAALGGVARGSDYERSQTLSASQILPSEVVRGEHYHVEEQVTNDGYLNSYRIASDFGRFESYGTTELAIRLREIRALGEIDELSKTEVFANAVKDGAMRSVRTIETFAEKPVETVKGVPQGVKKLLGRTKRSIESGVETAKELMADDGSKQGQDGEQDGGDEASDEPTDEKSRTEEAAEVASDYAKKYFGVNAAQRRWSQKLGVDPYTSNEVLREAIKGVAKVDSAGRFAVRLAPIPRIPGASTIATVNSLVWTMDPYELMQFNRKRLTEAGAAPEAIDAFYANIAYSPTRQTVLITALLSLGVTENLGQALLQAAIAESDDQARFFVAAAQMLAWYDANEMNVARLLPGEGAFVAAADDGRVVFHAPVDYLHWTKEIAEAAERLDSRAAASDESRELWLLGDASPRCRSELEARGWTLVTGIGDRLYEATKTDG